MYSKLTFLSSFVSVGRMKVRGKKPNSDFPNFNISLENGDNQTIRQSVKKSACKVHLRSLKTERKKNWTFLPYATS
jgi:hypothetical protein